MPTLTPHRIHTRASAGRASRGRTRLLGGLVAVAVLVAALPMLLVEGVLNGPPVMNGSARGTALVMLVVALPVLVFALASRRTFEVHRWALQVGALGYVTYNAMLFVYATPFNALFFAYVALWSLTLWALVSSLLDPWPHLQVGDRLPARSIAGFLLTVAALNALAWIARVAPDLRHSPPGFLDGTGLTTNPIYAQDLAVWLPAVTIVAVLLWQRRPAGVQLAGAALVFWLIEAVGVAVDQLAGHRAAPGSDVATLAGSVMFLVLAALVVVPLVLWWRSTPGGDAAAKRVPPGAHQRS